MMCGWSEMLERKNVAMPCQGSSRVCWAPANALWKQVFLHALMCVFVIAIATLSPAATWAAVSSESATYYEAAQAYLKKGDINAAAIQLKNAIRADENNVDARFALASIYLARRDGSNAEMELRAALARGISWQRVLLPLA